MPKQLLLTFDLILSQDSLNDDAKKLGVMPALLTAIRVSVSARLEIAPCPYLSLTYQIDLPAPLVDLVYWPDWQADRAVWSDFLWQRSCLECFIGQSGESGYVEINAAPSGEMAIYQFSEYRLPNQLPPMPLITPKDQLAVIDWQDFDQSGSKEQFQRQFGLDLTQLALPLLPLSSSMSRLQLHPCVILSVGDVSLYFAPSHAAPPDFHDRSYWQQVDKIKASG